MFLLLLALLFCSLAVCVVSYCKSLEKATPAPNVTNSSNHVNARSTDNSRSNPEICIVPTTSQLMDIYIIQGNTAAAREAPSKPPPSYGTIVVDEPPSYEQAVVVHVDHGGK